MHYGIGFAVPVGGPEYRVAVPLGGPQYRVAVPLGGPEYMVAVPLGGPKYRVATSSADRARGGVCSLQFLLQADARYPPPTRDGGMTQQQGTHYS